MIFRCHILVKSFEEVALVVSVIIENVLFFPFFFSLICFFEKVAERQGKYLASLLNKIGKASGGHANSAKDMDFGDPFVYKHLGSMATVGRHKALVDLRQSKVTLFILASLFSLASSLNKY